MIYYVEDDDNIRGLTLYAVGRIVETVEEVSFA